MSAAPLEIHRLAAAKRAFTTRRMPRGCAAGLIGPAATPNAGDVVLARVMETGQHDRLELPDGRRAVLFPGDEIIVAYGNRYAPDQFEAEVPSDLATCNLVAGGGIAARAVSWHSAMKPPTVIEPQGILADRDGIAVNVERWRLPRPRTLVGRPLPYTLAVVGTSMNAGKTTVAANVIKGFAAGGRRVGAAKVTGTGAGKDMWLMQDAGAAPVVDFTDAGHASTYLIGPRSVERVFETLVGHLAAAGVDVIVLEVADGLYQRETTELMTTPLFAEVVDGLIFAAGDSMGAAAGVDWLRARGLPVMATGGVLTASPLAMREAARATGLPSFDSLTLSNPAIAEILLGEPHGVAA